MVNLIRSKHAGNPTKISGAHLFAHPFVNKRLHFNQSVLHAWTCICKELNYYFYIYWFQMFKHRSYDMGHIIIIFFDCN